MPKCFRLFLQLLGLVTKYEPVIEDVAKEAKPLVKDLLAKQKAPK